MRVLSFRPFFAAFLLVLTVFMSAGCLLHTQKKDDPTQQALQIYYDRGLVQSHAVRRGVLRVRVSDVFLRLATEDQQAVLDSVARSLNTADGTDMFVVEYWRTGRVIGTYTQMGVQ